MPINYNNARFSKARIVSLLWVFSIAFFSSLLFPIFLPSLRLLFFAPFLIFALYNFSFLSTLWMAILAGAVHDLLSSQFFGLSALNYFLTILLIHRLRYFFADQLFILPLMTAIFAFISSLFQWLFYFFAGKNFPFFTLFVTEFLLMPLADATFGFLFFSLPLMIKKRRGVF